MTVARLQQLLFQANDPETEGKSPLRDPAAEHPKGRSAQDCCLTMEPARAAADRGLATVSIDPVSRDPPAPQGIDGDPT
jgi:hypothetical protein